MLRQEIRQSLRFFVRNPGFSAVAVLSLALGIGANAAVFSLTDVLLLRPLPVKDPGRVVTIATKLAWTPEVAAAETRRLDYARLTGRAPAFLAELDARHPGSSARTVLARTVAFLTGLGTAPPLALDRVACPVLVVVGDADPLVTRAECEEAVARLPHGRLAVLPGVGHLFEQMDLDVLASVVADFLR